MSQYQREPAVRVLASSFNNATYTFKDGDDERSPKFGILPTGVAVNRVLFMGTLTEIDDVGNDQTYLRGRVVDPTGAINVYAGQYQPEALSTLETLEAPTYVAVVGKLNTFEDDDGNVHVSIRPEQISTVSQAGRDRFLAEATSRTLKRIQALEQDEHPNAEIVEQYDVEASDLREAIQPAIDEFRRREERQTVKESPTDPVPS